MSVHSTNIPKVAALSFLLWPLLLFPQRKEAKEANQPHLSIEYVSSIVGYIEPCRCDASVLGGIARRFTYLKRSGRSAPRQLRLFAGDAFGGPGLEHRLKGETIFSFLKAAGYEAVLPGDSDLRFGNDAVAAAASAGLPVVCTNLPSGSVLPLAKGQCVFTFFLPGRRRPLRVGVTGVMGHDLLSGLEVEDALIATRRAVASLRRLTDFVVLMAHVDIPEALRIAETVPGVDLVVAGHVGSLTTPEPIMRGRTLVVANGDRGRYAARLDLWFDGNLRLARFRNRVTPLDASFPNDPQAVSLLLKFKRKLAEEVEALPPQEGNQSPFTGWRVCEPCHRAQTDQWRTTRHARAFASLVRGSQGLDASRPECLACHAVGTGSPGGYLNKRHTAHLQGVQCESCHGPGREHAETARSGRPSSKWMSRAVPERVCLRCHTRDQSPRFDYQRFLRQVSH